MSQLAAFWGIVDPKGGHDTDCDFPGCANVDELIVQ